MRRRGRRRKPMSTFTAGLIGIVVLVVFAYAAVTKFANPFASKFTIHALFSNANGLNPNSLVRIAGVNVGRVSTVSTLPGCKSTASTRTQCQAANVTMEIDPQGVPLHDDATFAIRPRIFLEGNFFVDVSPGSPSAPIAKDGHTFPPSQGTEPVQFDQVLGALPANTRQNLQLLLKGYGTAVHEGGPSYNASIKYWLPAYEYSAIVAHDALGLQPHDLSNWIAAQGTVAGALDAHPQDLKSLITNFNITAGAFARQNVALQNAVAELPKTLSAAIPAFNALNAAFPPLRALSTALIPGVESTGPTVRVSLPFLNQLRLLVQPAELQGLASDLSVTVPALARLTAGTTTHQPYAGTIGLMRDGVRPSSSCVANVIHPWSELTLNDGRFNASNGFPARKVYVEAVDFLPGLAGESRNFDANGMYVRILGALGNTVTTSTQPGLIGGALQPFLGEEPALPPGGRRPPLAPTVPCETQAPVSNLAATSAAPPRPTSVVPPLPLPLPILRLSKEVRSALTAAEERSIKQGTPIKLPNWQSLTRTATSTGTKR
jgi:phospholipid/cholesterol/gamma-HCH transport system substrate-binding protein